MLYTNCSFDSQFGVTDGINNAVNIHFQLVKNKINIRTKSKIETSEALIKKNNYLI